MPLLKTTTHTIDDIYALPDGQRAELTDKFITWHHRLHYIRN